MKVTRYNYEEVFLDYFEKRLSIDEISELMIFLGQNPDLSKEFENFENISLVVDEDVHFENKKSLLKPNINKYNDIDENNYDQYFAYFADNSLSPKDAESVNGFIKSNPFLEKDLNLYKLSVVKPDENIVYPDKEYLLKAFSFKPLIKRLVYYSTAAVVLLAVFLSLFYYFSSNSKINNNYSHIVKSKPIKSQPLISNNSLPKKDIDYKRIKPRKSNLKLQSAFVSESNTFVIDKLPALKSPQIKNSENTLLSCDFVAPSDEYIEFINKRSFHNGNMTTENNNDLINMPQQTFWNIASAGAEGLKLITNGGIKIENKKYKNKKVTTLALGDGFCFERIKH